MILVLLTGHWGGVLGLEWPAAEGEEGEGNKGHNGRKSTPGALHGYRFLPYRDEIPTSLTCP